MSNRSYLAIVLFLEYSDLRIIRYFSVLLKQLIVINGECVNSFNMTCLVVFKISCLLNFENNIHQGFCSRKLLEYE